MKVNNILIGFLLVFSLVLVGCSGGGGATDSGSSTTTITVVNGYIKDGNLTDNTGARATYSSNGRYTFSGSPQYPLTFTGGTYEDTNTSFDINMTAQEGSSVVSPITTFLENNSTLLGKLANLGFGFSTLSDFQVDYVDSNNSDVAKLSKMLYMVQKDTTLLNAFKTRLSTSNPANLNDIFSLCETDVNTTIGTGYTAQYRAFMNKVKSLTGNVSTYETQLKQYKLNMTEAMPSVAHNGTTYESVVSPFTGKVWLSKNLGASQVCTVFNDSNCYGDYYQWGRAHDGHQNSGSGTTATLANDINNVGHGNFITNISDWADTGIDDNASLRTVNRSKIDGSSICPVGYRVPTYIELENETMSASTAVTNNTDAFNNFLKLPSAGSRYYLNGYMIPPGTFVSLASNSAPNGSRASGFVFDTDSAQGSQGHRANGSSIRCIQGETDTLITNIESTNIYFGANHADGNTTDINASELLKVDRITTLFNQLPSNYSIKLEGNTDQWNSDEENFSLALQRSNKVRLALINKSVNSDKITMVSYGESNPVCSDLTEECWALNRRVTFKILP